jgi:hypothetical protein
MNLTPQPDPEEGKAKATPRRIAMKNILCLALLSAVAAVPVLSASAQEERASVTVPFSFHAGNSTLPAGTYIVTTDTMRHTISLASLDLRIHAGAIGMDDSWGNRRANLVVFQKYGNQYFLHRVVRSDVDSAIFLTPTKAEKQARRQIERAGLAIDDPVIVALNDNRTSLPVLEASR